MLSGQEFSKCPQLLHLVRNELMPKSLIKDKYLKNVKLYKLALVYKPNTQTDTQGANAEEP